jgi:GNAT superfamily N-acetyltransferase
MARTIRDATPDDAEAACDVMRRSIKDLCVADHRDDESVVEAWLANKQPEIFRRWLTEPDNSILIAEDGRRIVSVGAVRDSGEITLNYVCPDARFQGVSHELLTALEQRATERGNTRCFLTSTITARRFYLARAYVETGPAEETFGRLVGSSMIKELKRAS